MKKTLNILTPFVLVLISIPGHSQPATGSFAAGYSDRDGAPKSDLKVDRAYTEKRWIGLRSKGTTQCPVVDGWKFETLEDRVLSRATESLRAAGTVTYLPSPVRPGTEVDRSLLRGLELDRYCIYTPAKHPVEKFKLVEGLATAERDRLALSTTSTGGVPSDDLSQRIWPTLARHFRSQTGQMSSSENMAFTLTGEPSVRLTFIDSQPDGGWPPVTPEESGSRHGFTLMHMAHDLVCPTPGSCAAEIATRRALGYRRFNPEAPLPPEEPPVGQSGHVGLVSDLATALFAEVLYWRQFEPDKKLIINLSLGWDGEGFKDLDARSVSQLEPSVRAVYNALRLARRSGALVIASAGNRRGGGETRWPLLPAAWELRRPNWFRWAFFGKPVYAVGGVEGQGLPIANARKKGWPRRVAYADHAVTQIESSEDPTAIYTGTSVSAAVTSSIAAMVWHLRPELRPAQVMKLILHSGDVLDSRADFYALKPFSKLVRAPRIRRLSLCPAVASACGPDGKRCPALASSPECFPWDATPPDLGEPLAGFPSILCEAMTLQKGPLPEAPLHVESQRWVTPQPDEIPCPGCAIVGQEPPYELYLQISEAWKKESNDEGGFKLLKGTLVIECPGDDPLSQGLSADTLQPGQLPGPGLAHNIPIKDIEETKDFSVCKTRIDYEVELMAQNKKEPLENPVLSSKPSSQQP